MKVGRRRFVLFACLLVGALLAWLIAAWWYEIGRGDYLDAVQAVVVEERLPSSDLTPGGRGDADVCDAMRQASGRNFRDIGLAAGELETSHFRQVVRYASLDSWDKKPFFERLSLSIVSADQADVANAAKRVLAELKRRSDAKTIASLLSVCASRTD